jgi:hypothetical protein
MSGCCPILWPKCVCACVRACRSFNSLVCIFRPQRRVWTWVTSGGHGSHLALQRKTMRFRLQWLPQLHPEARLNDGVAAVEHGTGAADRVLATRRIAVARSLRAWRTGHFWSSWHWWVGVAFGWRLCIQSNDLYRSSDVSIVRYMRLWWAGNVAGVDIM